MTDNSPSTRPWLAPIYAARRRRTVELTRKAIEALTATDRHPSLNMIATKSRELDPDGRGVSQSAILNNPQARALYDQHKIAKKRVRPRRAPPDRSDLARLHERRDTTAARRRLMRLRKIELTDRVLAIEHEFAALHARYLKLSAQLIDQDSCGGRWPLKELTEDEDRQ